MHLFCEGFIDKVLSRDDELWEKMIKLRKFRNAIFHSDIFDKDSNIKSQHAFYQFTEDRVMFFYGPSIDFRGRKAETKSDKDFHTSMPQIREPIAADIKEIVDELVKRIVNSMNEETRRWISGWLENAMIPPRNVVYSDIFPAQEPEKNTDREPT